MININAKKTGPSNAKLLITLIIFILSAFPLFAATNDYAQALKLGTYFFGGQRCGNTQSWLHGACHTQDGSTQGMSLSGGWHDCGDHIKFSQTGAYAAALMLLSYLEFTPSFKDDYSTANSAAPSNGVPDVLDEIKIETDYLLNVFTGTALYYQAGTGGDPDHACFTEPVTQSGWTTAQGGNPRTAYSYNGSAANIAGVTAAALAYMAIAYRPYNSAYADSCLADAQAIYTFGKNSTGSSGSQCCYSSANWADDMCWAAGALYRATGTASYITDAANFYSNANYTQPSAGQVNYYGGWDHTEPYGAYELWRGTGTAAYRTMLQTAVGLFNGKFTSCGGSGYFALDGWGTFRYASAAAFINLLYYKIDNTATTAYNNAKANMDFILGSHTAFGNVPANYSFLMGYNVQGGGNPQHPHHRAAFGKTTAYNVWTTFNAEQSSPGSIPYGFYLTGAMIGGLASSCGNFVDNIGNVTTTEVCTDYNACFVAAMGALVSYVNPTTPTNTPVAQSPTFTVTFTRTATKTATKTATMTFTLTNTPNPPTDTFTPTFTRTATKTATLTSTMTYTMTNTPVAPTFTYTATFTGTATKTATRTSTMTYTLTNTPVAFTPTFTQTFTATATVSYTPTQTPLAPTNTFTATRSFTLTATPTKTSTETFTVTVTPSGTKTATLTVSNTQTMTATPTRTVTQSLTSTPTFTITETHTASPTETDYAGTPTDTYTPTPSFTVTQTGTASPTYTVTYTLTDTPTAEDTPTQTNTQTGTPTELPSGTNTPSGTQTMPYTATWTPSVTQTDTPFDTATQTQVDTPVQTYTQTPVNTITSSPTQTAVNSASPTRTNTPVITNTFTRTIVPTNTVTPTGTPVGVPTEKDIRIIDTKPYPCPYINSADLTVGFTLTRNAVKTEFYLYTKAMRLIRKYSLPGTYAAGYNTLSIDSPLFAGISRGVYYFVITATGDNKAVAKSRIEKLIILK